MKNTHETQAQTSAPNQWLTVKQVCERAHIGRSFIYEAWATGNGPRYAQVGGKRLVKDTWLDDWLLSHEVA